MQKSSITRNTSALIAALAFACLAILASRTPGTAQAPPPVYAGFEASQTNPIRLSADGTRLFAANTPNGTVSVFDVTQPASPKLLCEIPVGIEPVSVNPRTKDEVWVVSQVSNSISVVSVSKRIVTDTINLKALSKPSAPLVEPADVVFAGSNQAYISVARSNQIAVVDAQKHTLISALPVEGGSPRALAVSPDGTKVYAAFAISGNGTTGIQSRYASPQPPPANPALPPPPKVSGIVAANDPAWKSHVPFTMPDQDVVIIQTGASPTVAGYYSGVGTINLGLAVNPVTGDLYVANTDASNLVHFETNLIGHFVNNRITRITANGGQVTAFDLNPAIDYSVLPNNAALATALAQPTNVVFDPSGTFMYVAAFGTDRVAQVDTNGKVLSFVEVSQAGGSGSSVDPANKRGPRGLALNAPAQTLYSLNRISNTISVIGTAQNVVTAEVAVGNDPTPATVKQGRGFLYDAKLSGNGTASCAGCHVDGDMDHEAWDLGNPAGDMTSTVQAGKLILFHPMKGPMVTQTLHGLLNLLPYHWRGDKPNFAAFNAAFPSLMGGPQISDANMALFTTFINTLVFLPNPYRTLADGVPANIGGGNPANGLNDFLTVPKVRGKVTCVSCHMTEPGPGSNLRISTNNEQPLKVPQLRNVYQKLLYTKSLPTSIDGFGLFHDGTINGLQGLMRDPLFAAFSAIEKHDLQAFTLVFDSGTPPGVGYARTLTAGRVTLPGYQSDWNTLQSQALAGNIDLIARGTLAGQVHGLLYQAGTGLYVSDSGQQYTQANLQSLVQAGDTVTIMGVYKGSGSASLP